MKATWEINGEVHADATTLFIVPRSAVDDTDVNVNKDTSS